MRNTCRHKCLTNLFLLASQYIWNALFNLLETLNSRFFIRINEYHNCTVYKLHRISRHRVHHRALMLQRKMQTAGAIVSRHIHNRRGKCIRHRRAKSGICIKNTGTVHAAYGKAFVIAGIRAPLRCKCKMGKCAHDNEMRHAIQ